MIVVNTYFYVISYFWFLVMLDKMVYFIIVCFPAGEQCFEWPEVYDYSGIANRTTQGLACQRWDSQTPRTHSYTDPAQFPEAILEEAGNYCRDPDAKGWPWCYVTDTTWLDYWDYCALETAYCCKKQLGVWCI